MTFNLSSEIQENLCSIFHARFSHLRKIIPNSRQAQLMDYILLGWQTSTYKLRNSNQKWFMKEFSKIVEETGIPLSSLKRYLKEFEDKELIERRQALYSRTTDSRFECKKGCYISITPKLIFLLNEKKHNTDTELKSINATRNPPIINKNNSEKSLNKETITIVKEEDKFNNCHGFNQNETSEKLNLRRSNISNLYLSYTNNISDSYFLKTVDKNELSKIKSYLNAFEKTLFNNIKEEIPEEIKKLIFGTLTNLVVKHKVVLSSPEQIAAEYTFALINMDYFMKDIPCIKHRNNILAKLLRNNQWQTPKGFYNHFYLGKDFKDKNELREKIWEETKEKEIKNSPVYVGMGLFSNGERHHLLKKVDEKIVTIGELISDIENNLMGLNGDAYIKENDRIEYLTNELHNLYREQEKIEQEIENQFNFKMELSAERVA